jgi:hypothetical protein
MPAKAVRGADEAVCGRVLMSIAGAGAGAGTISRADNAGGSPSRRDTLKRARCSPTVNSDRLILSD